MSLELDNDGYVNLGDVCRDILGMQCQYGSQYVDPWYASEEAKQRGNNKPYLGEGLLIKGSFDTYHSLKIHKDRVVAFVTRVIDHKVSNHVWPESMRITAGSRLIAAGF